MRPAKLNRVLGGGSMTMIHLVPGNCATGISKTFDMSKYQTLSEEQKAKIKVCSLRLTAGISLCPFALFFAEVPCGMTLLACMGATQYRVGHESCP